MRDAPDSVATTKFRNSLDSVVLLAFMTLMIFWESASPIIVALSVLPWIALWLIRRSNGEYHLIPYRRNDPHERGSVLFLFAGVCLSAMFVSTYHVVSGRALVIAGSVAALPLVAATVWADRTMRGLSPRLLFPLIGGALYGIGLAGFADTRLDRTRPTMYQVRVVAARAVPGERRTSWRLVLAPWGSSRDAREVSVAYELYRELYHGGSACVSEFPGSLGIAWFRVGSCAGVEIAPSLPPSEPP